MTTAVPFQRKRKLGHVLWILTLCHNVVMKQHSKTLLLWIKKGRLFSHWGEHRVFFSKMQFASQWIPHSLLIISCYHLRPWPKTDRNLILVMGILSGVEYSSVRQKKKHPLVSLEEIRNTHFVTRFAATVQIPQMRRHYDKAAYSDT